MKRYKRTDRISELIHREISNIIDHEMKDNRIGMVTVTGVEVSKDIRYARVYVTVLGNNEIIKSSLETLNNASSFIRMSLGTKIILKHLPELTFHYDSSMAEGMRIDKLIEQIKINFDGD